MPVGWGFMQATYGIFQLRGLWVLGGLQQSSWKTFHHCLHGGWFSKYSSMISPLTIAVCWKLPSRNISCAWKCYMANGKMAKMKTNSWSSIANESCILIFCLCLIIGKILVVGMLQVLNEHDFRWAHCTCKIDARLWPQGSCSSVLRDLLVNTLCIIS